MRVVASAAIDEMTEKSESSSLGRLPESVFIGRQQEMSELSAALDAAFAGHGQLVMLVGQPGIGKTRTSQELASIAEERGAQVLWGRCYEGQGAPPYWPWIQIIRSYVQGHHLERWRSVMGMGATDIAEVVPEVKELLPDFEPSPGLEPEQARFRLFDSITSFLKNASIDRPLVLLLDNLHWADRSSLLLLEFLSQELTDARILVIGTYRDEELFREHPLPLTLGELTKHEHFQRIVLRGLTHESIRQLIELVSGDAPSEELAEVVSRQTEGNPFFVTEVVRMLAQEGRLTQEPVEGQEGPSLKVPEGVKEAIGRRLHRLSGNCNQVLTVASVVGREFELELMKRLIPELSEERFLGVVEEALSAGIIEEMPGAVGRYQFTHVLIQETLSQELSAARRARLHGEIGEALEGLYAVAVETHADELAYHFAEAEPALGGLKLVRYSLLAGERALAAYAWEDAQAHFERALAAKGGQTVDEETAAVLHGMGLAQLALHQQNAAIGTMTRAFDYYAEAGDVTKAAAIVGSHFPRGWALRNMGPLVSKALAILPPDSKEAAELLSTYGVSQYLTMGDYDAAQDAFERGLAIARRGGDVALEVRVLAHAAQADAYHLNWQESLEKSLQVLELAQRVSEPYADMSWEGHNWACISLMYMGRIEQARLHADAKDEVARSLRDRFWISGGLLTQQVMSQLVGDFESARAASDACLAGVPHLGSLVLRTLLEHELGDFAEGERYMERLLERVTTEPIYLASDVGWFSVISLVGRITETESHFDICQSAADTVLSSTSATRVERVLASLSLALMAAQVADVGAIEEHWGILESSRGQMLGAGNAMLVNADRILGLLAHAMGTLDDAEAHFEVALAFCRKAGYRPELAWTCHDYAALQHARGQKAEALTLLEEALTVSTELGMRPLVERVVALQEKARSQPARKSEYPAGLTAREVEILLLMAQGKTTREIAIDLVISPRTVQRHTTNLYAKINARNRVEATAFALNELSTST